jgi:hypothetical protein
VAHNHEFMKQFAAATQQPQAYPMVAPASLPPQAMPLQYALGEIKAPNGMRVIVLQIATPLGLAFYFFRADEAERLADNIRAQVAGIVLTPPNGAPVKG